jgi:hypothetical protein
MTNNNNLAPTIMWPMNATDYSNVQANGYTTRRVEVRAIHPTTGMISSVQTVQLVPDSGNQSNTTTYARPNKNNQSVENMV